MGAARAILLWTLFASPAAGQAPSTPAPAEVETSSKFTSEEDGWFDVSGFLDSKYGFLPLAMPITEPAVGYGAAGGLAFLSRPLADLKDEYHRPNITAVAGFGTQNGTWGVAAADLRHWLDGSVQTLTGIVHASINLDFFGIGDDPTLKHHPLRYEIEPTGGMVQGKLRLGESRFFAGLGYAFASTDVRFDAPDDAPGLPDIDKTSRVGGVTPSLTYDTRDNIFTPDTGTYIEASVGVFASAFGGDDEFQRIQLLGMQFIPLSRDVYLGLRGQATTTGGDTPFYLEPYVNLRGAPIFRYQGEDVAQIEGELRWQFWERLSVVGFVGEGVAWNDFDRFDDSQSVLTGGFGLRYELARKYGIHAGVDVAFGPDTTAVYLQIGSAWSRP
jgi:hypothetical protein